MLTKLKYVGVPTADLIHIYLLYIRSLLEYCSVVWHSTLTVQQSDNLERVQKLSLKIILGQYYDGYENALKWSGLERLVERREQRCLKFGLKSLLHPVHSKMFPINPLTDKNLPGTRHREHFVVNKAKSEYYKKSAIPHIQRQLRRQQNQ